jgi:HSP20 family molecular chaperone IbpA
VDTVTGVAQPPVNIYESVDSGEGRGQLTVAIPLPGAHHDTVEVSLDGGTLSVRAEARYPQAQQHYLRHEWQVGRSHVDIGLPKAVNPHGARATLTHGVLTVSLPLGEARGPARIPVIESQPHPGVQG